MSGFLHATVLPEDVEAECDERSPNGDFRDGPRQAHLHEELVVRVILNDVRCQPSETTDQRSADDQIRPLVADDLPHLVTDIEEDTSTDDSQNDGNERLGDETQKLQKHVNLLFCFACR